ncbi:MAG: O-methyltransferase [Lachnospiraceae bacterium]|nr:O-methyltransferase [Lachnospiraceae bacterium]
MVIDERLSVYLNSLLWDIPGYLQETEKNALAGEVPVIKRSTQTLLAFLLRMAKPDAVLEIGTAIGFSAMLSSEYTSPGTVIDTIEKVPARIKNAKENFKKFNKEDRINLIEGDANKVLWQLVSQEKKYNFIFMDAAKGQYMNFVKPVYKLLVAGGILVTDNVLQDGDVIQSRYAVTRRDRTIHSRMREYLYYLSHSEEWDTIILPVGDGVAVSVKQDRDSKGQQNGDLLC